MKTFKSLLLNSPNYYLLILTIIAIFKQPIAVTIALALLIVLLVLQIIFQNRITGFIFASVFFLINLYFLGALFSEFNEFSELNAAAIQLIFVGLTVVIINFCASGVMIYKYGFYDGRIKTINQHCNN